MVTKLSLVSVNPRPVRGRQHDPAALHRLADRLTDHVQAGHAGAAHVIARAEQLNPMDTATIATWMARAGLSETQILAVMAS